MAIENGTLVLLFALGASLTAWVWWPLGLVYLGYCILSIFLYLTWVCPYCSHYATHTCPSGYHLIPVQPARPKEGKTFAEQFRRNVAVLYPVWILPPVAGVYQSLTRFSWPVPVLTILFCLYGFAILPSISQQHSCKYCGNADCPRRRGKSPSPAGAGDDGAKDK